MIAATFVAGVRGQETPALPPLLQSAAGYIDTYAKQLSGVVVEETYEQFVRYQPPMRPGALRPPPAGPDHRRLKSDLLLIRPRGADSWRQFRDVFEVDGRPVRDRNDRLQRLFLNPAPSAEAQAQQIADESARYNIGDIQRTINLPLLTLLVLDRAYQAQFGFRIDKSSRETGNLPRSQNFVPRDGTQAISYDEQAIRTMIRGIGDRNLPIHGRVWVEPGSGRVWMTELLVVDAIVDARIHVAYREDEALGMLVPSEMHESYERKADRMRIEGTATYANVRRFQVQTDESLTPVR